MSLSWIMRGLATFGLCGMLAAPAMAGELSVAEEILDILKTNGQISASQHEQLVMKVRDERQRESMPTVAADKASWYDRLSFSGDFRFRNEDILYGHDRDDGESHANRHRLRIRARLGVQAQVNDYFDVKLRFASGDSGSATSRNQTLGNGDDFDPDDWWLDQAYVVYRPFGKSTSPLGGERLELTFGKMPNAFRSKHGKDMILWDGDIMPEGAAVAYVLSPSEALALTLNGAWFVIDEESANGSDPHLVATQLRADWKGVGSFAGGAAASYYSWHSLDTSFVTRAETIASGLTGPFTPADMDIADFRAWAMYSSSDRWPVKVYGNVTRNFDAENASGEGGREDRAWSAGVELGSKKKLAHVGLAYFRVGANAVPRNFIDADLFGGDGVTNRKGWVFYAARQLFTNTDLKLTFLKGKPLDADVGSLDMADRHRIQTDLIVKF